MSIVWLACTLIGPTFAPEAVLVERPLGDQVTMAVQEHAAKMLYAELPGLARARASAGNEEPRRVAARVDGVASATIVVWLDRRQEALWIVCDTVGGGHDRARHVSSAERSAEDLGHVIATLARVLAGEIREEMAEETRREHEERERSSGVPEAPPEETQPEERPEETLPEGLPEDEEKLRGPFRIGALATVAFGLPSASTRVGGVGSASLWLSDWWFCLRVGVARVSPRTLGQQVRLRSLEIPAILAAGYHLDPFRFALGMQLAPSRFEARVLPFGEWESFWRLRVDAVIGFGAAWEVGPLWVQAEVVWELAMLRPALERKGLDETPTDDWTRIGARLGVAY